LRFAGSLRCRSHGAQSPDPGCPRGVRLAVVAVGIVPDHCSNSSGFLVPTGHAACLRAACGSVSWRRGLIRATLARVTSLRKIVVCEGDETGQELLDESLRVLDPSVLGFELELIRFDLSLDNRRRTANAVVYEAAAAMREAGLGLKAATVTPETTGDVGSPNRILREGIGGSVIVRTGRRIPGVAPLAPVVHPIVVVRMAVGDAYGAEEGRTGPGGDAAEQAWRTERIDRSVCRSVSEYSFRAAADLEGCVYGGPKWTVSTIYEGMLKEEMDAAAARHPDVPYRPTLIDAAYAGLLTESGAQTLVVPALNRDGDCISDLVLALFGSIAGAESMLLALDDSLQPVVAMAEAPHGTAPSLFGKNVANPMAMLLATAAALEHAAAGGDATIARAARAIRQTTLSVAADGIRTFDLGGEASTSGVVDEVLRRLRVELAA
jgi:isocitrate dehydrogenase (NAD+)